MSQIDTPDEAFPSDDRGEPPHTKLHRVLTVLLPALVVIGLLAYGFLRPAEPDQAGEAPAFDLPLLAADGTLSSDDLRGHPIVLNFWASWCLPCREEMPAFERMWRRYRDRGLRVVGVTIQDSRRAAREFVEELGITYPIVFDGSETLSRKFDVFGLPQTMFINRAYELSGGRSRGPAAGPSGPGGTVVYGAISEVQLEKKIEDLLARP